MPTPWSTEQNKAVIIKLLEEVDRGNLEIFHEYYAADYVDHTPSPLRELAPGLEGIKQAFRLLYSAFPDTVHVIDDLIAEGDKVVVRLHATATHTGQIFDTPPTGKKVTLSSIVIYRLEQGKIVERWVAQQGPGVLQQIGVTIPSK